MIITIIIIIIVIDIIIIFMVKDYLQLINKQNPTH